MWYPSYDCFSGKGTLTGIYTYSDQAIAFGKMSLKDRIVAARRGAIKLHQEFRSEAIVLSAEHVMAQITGQRRRKYRCSSRRRTPGEC